MPKNPGSLSDIVFNLGVRESFSDRQTVSHLVRRIRPKPRRPIVSIPGAVVVAAAYLMTAATRLDNRTRGRNRRRPPSWCSGSGRSRLRCGDDGV